MLVTKKLLRKHGAGCGQVGIFSREWPDGVEVTLANVRRAQELGLSIEWFAQHCLPPAAHKAYLEGEALLWKPYEEGEALLRKAYLEGEALSGKAYLEGVAPLRKAYEEAVARLLVRVLAEMDAPRARARGNPMKQALDGLRANIARLRRDLGLLALEIVLLALALLLGLAVALLKWRPE